MLRSRSCLGGMVTAPHHLAAQAGANVLRQGGNAVEAAIATAATIAVVYPHMNSIGGDGFWLISEPGKDPIAIQACGKAAGLATPSFYRELGHKAIPSRGPLAALTVAGAVGGWNKALKLASQWGKSIPLPLLLEEAITHARNGAVITESQSKLTKEKWSELHSIPGFTDVYAPNGCPETGDILQQANLADILQQLANVGLEDFYQGDLAIKIGQGLEKSGSPLRLNDLKAYEAKIVKPLSLQLKSSTVYNLPPPTQGISSLMILGIFEQLQSEPADSFSHIHNLIEATKRAFIIRNKYVADPVKMGIDYHKWLEPSFLKKEAEKITPNKAALWPHVAERGDTIWLGCADKQGRVVSYIQSIYWEFGSGVLVPDTGILWQNRGSSFTLSEGPKQLAPGLLPFHTLNPALARFKDGRTMAYGTMGGEGQPQTQAAIFTRYAHYNHDLQESITAPRWLLGKTWGQDATNLKIEARNNEMLIAELGKAGHDIETVSPYDDLMGHAGAVVYHPNGRIEGATDPRSDGGIAAI